jgi:hypothetical protein
VLEGGLWTIVIRVALAGRLITLPIRMPRAANAASLMMVFVIKRLVRVPGTPNVIGGSTEIMYLCVSGAVGVGACATYPRYCVDPTLLGYPIRGVSLVAALNHVQIGSVSCIAT